METRPLVESDLPTIEAMHNALGFDYRMPNLSDPLFVVKMVGVEKGQVVSAFALKLCAEVYLWVDPNTSLKLRYNAIRELSKVCYAAAWTLGLDCLVAWLPPSIPPAFCKLLTKLGWSRARNWETWNREVEDRP